jgi:membrane protein implicated in regulation of membrane protease activity
MKEKQKNERRGKAGLVFLRLLVSRVFLFFLFPFALFIMVIMLYTSTHWLFSALSLAFALGFFAFSWSFLKHLDYLNDDRHLIEDAEDLKDIIDEVVEAQVEEKEKRHMR